uniref:Uncharacterized protein n=1 Tax=Anguilla anguilla TaxID=7936 RepID=A0A0E9VH28_ANGAN
MVSLSNHGNGAVSLCHLSYLFTQFSTLFHLHV